MAMVTVAAASRVPLFDRKKRKQRRQTEERIQDELRVAAAATAKDELKFETLDYLNEFLVSSGWRDEAEQISIVWEKLPPLKELEAYATLDETDGTRACRKLFKAVVVWDEVGHSLWKKLKADLEEQEEDKRRNLEPIAEDWPGEVNPFSWSSTSCRSGSHCSRSSRKSIESSHSPRSSVDLHRQYDEPTTPPDEARRPSLPWATVPLGERLAMQTSGRRSTEPPLSSLGDAYNSAKAGGDSRFTLPKLVSQNCANVVKKTLGRFSESRSSRNSPRGSI